jgi:opacity protein-like surface antigen
MKSLGLVLLLVGLSSSAFAADVVAAPEISAASGAPAVTLLSGALLVIRGRRKH